MFPEQARKINHVSSQRIRSLQRESKFKVVKTAIYVGLIYAINNLKAINLTSELIAQPDNKSFAFSEIALVSSDGRMNRQVALHRFRKFALT